MQGSQQEGRSFPASGSRTAAHEEDSAQAEQHLGHPEELGDEGHSHRDLGFAGNAVPFFRLPVTYYSWHLGPPR